jgi:hypothetical protein
VALFVERARAIDPTFDATNAIAALCTRLDGLPLAIELAAARVGVLAPEQLLARLDRTLPLLTAGARDAPARQRTLRATIEWSHDLLDADEQRLFRRLAAFAASFELDAVGPVCEGDLDRFQSLVEKSLVRRWGSGRFGLLETVAEFAEERLAASDEDDAIRARHAAHYLAVAQSANLADDAEGPQDQELAAREQANFRKALEWALDRDVELGFRLAIPLEQLWVARQPFEGIRWFESLFAAAGELEPALHARALVGLGGLVFIAGDFERGKQLYEESLAEYTALGDDRGRAQVLHRLPYSAMVEGDFARARALAEESLALHRRFGGRKGEAVALGTLADIEWRSGGDRERALELGQESAAIAREVGFVWWRSSMLTYMCEWSLELGQRADAERFGVEALELAHRMDDRMHRIYVLALLARVAAEDGRRERAGVLWGALEADEARGPIGQWEDERETYAAPVLACANEEFERGRLRGHSLSLDEVVEETCRDARRVG